MRGVGERKIGMPGNKSTTQGVVVCVTTCCGWAMVVQWHSPSDVERICCLKPQAFAINASSKMATMSVQPVGVPRILCEMRLVKKPLPGQGGGLSVCRRRSSFFCSATGSDVSATRR